MTVATDYRFVAVPTGSREGSPSADEVRGECHENAPHFAPRHVTTLGLFHCAALDPREVTLTLASNLW